ncbi:class I SAM-dependent methyltransferase [Methanoculleus sp. FWC-SCC1]|uniref:Class I SAM-dependent methyltransferase n=1 Tax=Methanoculleus frigidifontis TaxID=2584085 RepID=A0ABT8M6X0_9EURY|nr:class I SAM-dependent methyltransferase [Methanoculleus sp. FWC-SCC1]MDN7023679.1 class I SAM-dependent methyltransferase [Methanoculleus sp. FWC-SCC1]
MTIDPWDQDYRRRGRRWGGVTEQLPDLPAGVAVLEIGCGDGKTLAAAADRPWVTTALDIAPSAVGMSRTRFPALGARMLVADARTLPFRDCCFDAVLLVHIAGHLLAADRFRLAAEVSRVLRPGGLLFFRGFSVEDMRAGKGHAVEERTYQRGDGIVNHYFTEEEAGDLFCTFRPVAVRTHRWRMRIRGCDHPRAEIEAVFEKQGGR